MSHAFEGHKIFFPQFKRGKEGLQIFPGTILEHARKLGIEIASECGGQGICGRCVVRIDRGAEALNPLTAVEKQFELGKSERLACQASIVKPANIYVFIKSTGQYSILSESIRREVALDSLIYAADDQVLWQGPDGERLLGAYTGNLYGAGRGCGNHHLSFPGG